MNFGEKLRMLRKEKKINQTQLAESIGVSLRTVRNWETEDMLPKQAELYDKVAEVLSCDVTLLRDDSDLFITRAGEVHGLRGRRQAENLVNGISGMFAGGELSDEDKDAVMQALQEAYWSSKETNKKYTPFRFRNEKK